jgi:hypothetical protein
MLAAGFATFCISGARFATDPVPPPRFVTLCMAAARSALARLAHF